MAKEVNKCLRCGDKNCLYIGGTTKCSKCETLNCYSEKYDSYFCLKCNEWLEKKCGDKHCEFCSKKPDRPIKNKKD